MALWYLHKRAPLRGALLSGRAIKIIIVGSIGRNNELPKEAIERLWQLFGNNGHYSSTKAGNYLAHTSSRLSDNVSVLHTGSRSIALLRRAHARNLPDLHGFFLDNETASIVM